MERIKRHPFSIRCTVITIVHTLRRRAGSAPLEGRHRKPSVVRAGCATLVWDGCPATKACDLRGPPRL
jgi:hypothetical protein